MKLRASVWLHDFFDRIFLGLPFPNIDPKIVSFVSVFLSIVAVVLLRFNKMWFILLYLLAMLLDGVDGIIARKYGTGSHEGYLCDVMCDRLSEGIVMVNFLPWFGLFTLNLFLSIFSIAKKKHRILPLRFLFIVYYAIWIL